MVEIEQRSVSPSLKVAYDAVEWGYTCRVRPARLGSFEMWRACRPHGKAYLLVG